MRVKDILPDHPVQIIGVPGCIPLFFPTDSDDYYIDELGGVHDSGCGWAPDGTSCGECSHISCKICGVWNKTKASGTNKFRITVKE